MDLTGRNIVLGVTGGIAAYKSAELVSRLRHLGANVHVIMTQNATEFVSPLTFQTLSANQVVTDTFQAPEYWNVEHVALAKLAEVFVIAPATANIIAKMAAGIADDMLSTTVLATKVPVLALLPELEPHSLCGMIVRPFSFIGGSCVPSIVIVTVLSGIMPPPSK